MSGGSYDYLCFNTDDLSGHPGQLEQMAQRLEGLPYAAVAAAETRRVVRLLNAAEALARSLADVWHDVEWWDSNDYGESAAVEACRAYRAPEADMPEGAALPPDPAALYRLVDVGRGRYELRAVALPADDPHPLK